MSNSISQFYDEDFINKFGEQSSVLNEVTYNKQVPEVNVEEIAKKMGLKVSYCIMPESGNLEEKNIKVNTLDAPVRQRFTIAHELGHYLLHKPDDVVYRDVIDNYDTLFDRIREREANNFAADLLMPEKLLSKTIDDYLKEKNWSNSLDNIQFETLLTDIANKLNVSKISLEYRLKNLNIVQLGVK